MSDSMIEPPTGSDVPPLPHMTGRQTATVGRTTTSQGAKWAGVLLNVVAFVIGSGFLLWVCGLLVALMTEGHKPGALSTTDILSMIAFLLLGVGSIARLALVFAGWSQRRKEVAG